MARMLHKTTFCVLVGLLCTQCGRAPETPEATVAERAPAASATAAEEPILPIASAASGSAEKIALGRRLYSDTGLSGRQRRVSCATCHPLDQGGTTRHLPDHLATDPREQYDIPTVFNSADHFAYFWNGRAQSLEAVIQASIRSEQIMDTTWGEILARLEEQPEYRETFAQVYPGAGIADSTVVDALVAFLQTLSTPNAAFDRWLDGEPLPERAREGYALFKQFGCVRCHQGAGVGGNLFASFAGYMEQKDTIRPLDYGRFNITNNEAHRFQFKVPSLRNVAVTAPYFHDGSAKTLGEAVEAMALHQLGRTLTPGERDRIVAFLESLTGWYGERLLGTGPEQASE